MTARSTRELLPNNNNYWQPVVVRNRVLFEYAAAKAHVAGDTTQTRGKTSEKPTVGKWLVRALAKLTARHTNFWLPSRR